MYFEFKGVRSKIVVGLKFGQRSQNLAKTASNLSLRTQMSLRAVHVLEEKFSLASYLPDLLESYDGEDWEEELTNPSGDMDKALLDLGRTFDSKIAVEMQVLRSRNIADALVAESHNASLLLLGVKSHDYPIIPEGLSVVLQAVESCPIPTLIVRDGGPLAFADGYKMLIADDLSFAGLSALNIGIKFALATGAGSIHHIHFMSPELAKLSDKFPTKDGIEVIDRIKDSVSRTLRSRSNSAQQALKYLGCSFSTEVREGKISSDLQAVAEAFEADLIVLGKKNSSRLPYTGVGRLAVNSAASFCAATLVVPSV